MFFLFMCELTDLSIFSIKINVTPGYCRVEYFLIDFIHKFIRHLYLHEWVIFVDAGFKRLFWVLFLKLKSWCEYHIFTSLISKLFYYFERTIVLLDIWDEPYGLRKLQFLMRNGRFLENIYKIDWWPAKCLFKSIDIG